MNLLGRFKKPMVLVRFVRDSKDLGSRILMKESPQA